MSAFLCTDEHFMELAKFYCENNPYNKRTVQDVANILKAENIKSLIYRYQDDDWGDDTCKVDRTPRKVTLPAAIGKMIGCYEYQSCEHDDWVNSNAKELCDAMMNKLINELEGYSDAPWAYSLQDTTKRVA